MRVLLSLDSSECSRDALESTANQKWPDGTTIKVVTVVEPFEPDGVDSNSSFVSSLREKRHQDAQTLLDEAVELLKANCDAQIESDKKEDYKTDKAIIDLAREWSADLVAVGSRNRTGIERMFLGSVSNAVLLKAPCSVAVIKAEPEQSSDKTNVLIAIDGSSYSKTVIESVSKRPWSKNVNFKLISAVEPDLQNIQIPNPVAVLGEIEDSKNLESKMQII